MSVLYAKPVEYAIRALTYLARSRTKEPVTVQDIAKAEGVSPHHLSKVMKNLSQHKIVHSLRGPGGGYNLIVDPEKINLKKVLQCFGLEEQIDFCALGDGPCNAADPCPLHNRWSPIREQIKKYYETVTIAELAAVASEKKQAFPPSGTPPVPTIDSQG